MCSFALRHWIILFLSILVVQIGTMKCFTAHKKTCLWSPGIHCPPMIKFFCGTSTLMLVKGQIITCTPPRGEVFAPHAPSACFSRHSSSTSSSAPQSVDSGLQVPSGPLVVSGAATCLATELVEACVHLPSSGMLCLHSENHFSPQHK